MSTTAATMRSRMQAIGEHVVGLLVNRCAVCMSVEPEEELNGFYSHGKREVVDAGRHSSHCRA